MRRTILFTGIIVFLVAAAIAIVGILSKPDTESPSLFDRVTAPATPDTGVVQAPEPSLTRPSGETIDIGTSRGIVRVKNFYPEHGKVGEALSILLVAETGYRISYEIPGSRFWIAIQGAPFENIRSIAEAKLLTTLGVSQEDACKLDVLVGVPYDPANLLSGRSFPLSFCAILVR